MSSSGEIEFMHKAMVHDVAFNYHGNRMATCSKDRIVKIWNQSDDGQWHCCSSWEAHNGAVRKVTWAHPEYGQIIATCSEDLTIKIWTETISNPHLEDTHTSQELSQWRMCKTFFEIETPFTDMKFGPRFRGLQLATCTYSGWFRVYRNVDIANLDHWYIYDEKCRKQKCNCLSWSNHREEPNLIAVGCNGTKPHTSGGNVLLYEFCGSPCLWTCVQIIKNFTLPVHDISFAPDVGRFYNQLAVASDDLHILAFTTRQTKMDSKYALKKIRYYIRPLAKFNEQSITYRISWNSTGTVLSSSSDDRHIRLYKAVSMDNWKCISTISLIKDNASNIPPDVFPCEPTTS